MHPLLQTKLDNLTTTYKKRSLLMYELPEFASVIAGHYNENEVFSGSLGSNYKGMYFAWGLQYYEYFGNTGRVPTNFQGSFTEEKGLICVYINNLTLFDEDCYSFSHQELGKIVQSINCFYYDDMNTTFYFEPKELMAGLDVLVSWYNQVRVKTDSIKKAKDIERLEQQLNKLKGE